MMDLLASSSRGHKQHLGTPFHERCQKVDRAISSFAASQELFEECSGARRRLIGRGSHSLVWLASQKSQGNPDAEAQSRVAMKEIDLKGDPAAVALALREVEVLQSLCRPDNKTTTTRTCDICGETRETSSGDYLVRFLGARVIWQRGVVEIALRYHPQGSLRAWLDSNRQTKPAPSSSSGGGGCGEIRASSQAPSCSQVECHDFAVGILKGLCVLHNAGWCHGDLRPSNILLRRSRRHRQCCCRCCCPCCCCSPQQHGVDDEREFSAGERSGGQSHQEQPTRRSSWHGSNPPCEIVVVDDDDDFFVWEPVLADFGLAARITIPHPDNNGTKEGDRSAGANYDTREMAVVPVVEGGDRENEGGGGVEVEEDGEEDGDGSRSIPCGALLCCPPECLDSCRSGGAAADMWALGVVLWEIIEGVHPIPWQHRQLLIRKQQQKQRQHTSSLAGEHLQQLIPPAPPHVAHSPAEQPISSSFQPASAEVDEGTSRRRRGGVEEEAISKLSVGMFSANVNDEQGGVLDDDDDVEEGQFDGSDLWAISEAADELPASAALIARELMQRLELGDNNNNKRGGLPSDESSGHAWAAVAADTSSSSSFSVKAACPRAMAKTLLRSSSWAVVNTCVVIDPKSRPSAPALLTRIKGGAMNLNLN